MENARPDYPTVLLVEHQATECLSLGDRDAKTGLLWNSIQVRVAGNVIRRAELPRAFDDHRLET